jgi:hypothetical protein
VCKSSTLHGAECMAACAGSGLCGSIMHGHCMLHAVRACWCPAATQGQLVQWARDVHSGADTAGGCVQIACHVSCSQSHCSVRTELQRSSVWGVTAHVPSMLLQAQVATS